MSMRQKVYNTAYWVISGYHSAECDCDETEQFFFSDLSREEILKEAKSIWEKEGCLHLPGCSVCVQQLRYTPWQTMQDGLFSSSLQVSAV